MEIVWFHPSQSATDWIHGLQQRLPQARVRAWAPGDNAPADYALVRSPPPDMLRGRHALKGVFALGAGVDEILRQLAQHPDMLTDNVPLYRLKDTGMAQQMQEYALCRVLGWFRRFDDYLQQQQSAQWQPLPSYPRETFHIGILGAGVLGQQVAETLKARGFPVRVWSRSPKQIPGVTSFAGAAALNDFLRETRVLINLLPSTPETRNLIDHKLLQQLPQEAFFLNLARGDQVVEADLLAALDRGQLKGAALDVFQTEPLPADHPLWFHPRVTITPHNAAVTLKEEAMDFIADAIGQLERGEHPQGLVDRQRGY
ncbi:glyoxylate/hydroxypyruvate reductase GhrA [Pantoea ananatis]|uniref:Putative 2-hydroxyacid dehydrogenase YedW n=1 Tax=Pantoea ananas TaxID=553 RepID=A0A2S1CSZ6_PANAN|nr:glyoxylate/hydroxypyruvate reductase GhrA [Pantoea ananatis]AWD38004.1 putative 2-hydroxyacid dehydrogenase YedW [Pantoea ananatis]PKC39691.1 bifunctional glyoxylate/hydroxypyruvate reductase A [Pantoea ananatis 15320]PQK69633.1 bifunctional glyoxylate/hydroxypyruvate reductase A [Pantoea ananatis]